MDKIKNVNESGCNNGRSGGGGGTMAVAEEMTG